MVLVNKVDEDEEMENMKITLHFVSNCSHNNFLEIWRGRRRMERKQWKEEEKSGMADWNEWVLLRDKDVQFARKSIGFMYFHNESHDGPLLQRLITWGKVNYKNRRAQQDTRNAAKTTLHMMQNEKIDNYGKALDSTQPVKLVSTYLFKTQLNQPIRN